MPFFRSDLVILQALKPELAFDALTQLFVMVSEILRNSPRYQLKFTPPPN
ncbi:MAG: hypothetical protein OJF50_000007 [Nitrospira sp.]|jgi:hypothetical protein|nr:hypothetical protein [Nitrospira sp.]